MLDNRLNTLFVGKVLKSHPKLDSTNMEAERLLYESKPAEGTAIITNEQTNGRGQMGNSWHSGIGENLTVSFIFYPTFLDARQQFALNQAISLAVRDCLLSYTDDIHIKWPNDILIGNKKISGMLIQNSLSGNRIKSSIVGIGINVNQQHFPDGSGNPISLFQQLSKLTEIEDVFVQLCKCIEYRYLQLKKGNIQVLQKDYHQYLYLQGKEYEYRDCITGKKFEGIINRVLPDGRLEVNTSSGLRHFMFKEISIV